MDALHVVAGGERRKGREGEGMRVGLREGGPRPGPGRLGLPVGLGTKLQTPLSNRAQPIFPALSKLTRLL